MKLTSYFNLVWRLNESGAIPLLSLYTFMASIGITLLSFYDFVLDRLQ